MLRQLRHTIIKNLVTQFHHATPQLKLIEEKLHAKGMQEFVLDHFALIDLPGPETGIFHLSQIFTSMGYVEQGRDYLPDKQNDFLWLAEVDSKTLPAREVLPQVVVADFRLDELPSEIKIIIEKYGRQAPPSPVATIQKLIKQLQADDLTAMTKLNTIVLQYLTGRDWPLPTRKEFLVVYEFNQLLAWVLLFGRKPNHFTIAVHLLEKFPNLQNFLDFIHHDVGFMLNEEGGRIKGNPEIGIEQGSTIGIKQLVQLADGNIFVLSEFVEFIWRFSRLDDQSKPIMWSDYHVGFIPQHANQVIQSLYETEKLRWQGCGER